jgi:hypothetical protein
MVPAADGVIGIDHVLRGAKNCPPSDDRDLRLGEKNKSIIDGTFIGSLHLPAVRSRTHDNR